jgi:hypothetical protein
LEISLGGRAEIQDTLIVGDQGSATGTILVDGFDSFLGSGGFEAMSNTNMPPAEIGAMMVGRLGTGLMNITNGGQVVSLGREPSGQSMPRIAAVIGGNPYGDNVDDDNVPESGGQGVVNVDGAGSKWVVGGNLQVGGFHNSRVGNTTDVKGILALYPTSVGRGTLNVGNDGLVNLVFPSDGSASSNDLFGLVIGRFGRVNLGGDLGPGRIEITGGFETTGGGTDPDPLLGRVHVLNDGVITGDGYIGTGRLLNRSLGEIRVDAGSTLVVDANGGFDLNLNPPVLPLQNYGLVAAVGSESARAEVEFVGVSLPGTNPNSVNETFFNGRLDSAEILAQVNGGRTFGLIHAQYGTVRFRSGLRNQGEMAFTAGDNIVSGDTINLGPGGTGTTTLDRGVITVTGNGTTVVFEDDLTNQGNITVDPGTFLSVLGDFNASSGTLNLRFGGGFSNAIIGHVSVGGDALLGGTLNVSLGSNPPNFMIGDSFEILSTAGQLVGTFAEMIPPLPGGLTLVPVYDYVAGTVTLEVSPFTPTGVLGDYNNNGIVDAPDYVVWRDMPATLSNEGASPGIVDQADYDFWRARFGATSGSGAALSAAVPEPSATMLALWALLATAFGCRGRIELRSKFGGRL